MGEDGGLIAGHARVLAARQLGIAEIPVMVAAGWSEGALNKFKHRNNQWREAERGLERVGRPKKGPTLPLSRRARARARVGDGNQRPWPAD